MLLIANSNSADSTNLLNYYLAHRPMVQKANVLVTPMTAMPYGCYAPCDTNSNYLDYATNEGFQSRSDMETQLIAPVLAWLRDNPTKHPQYIILLLDVPTRVYDCANQAGASVSLQTSIPGRGPFITHINMGSYADCTNYVNKLQLFGNTYSPGKIIIRASAGGYSNSHFCFDDAQRKYIGCLPGQRAAVGVLASGGSTNHILYVSGSQHITSAANVGGYLTWGANGQQGGGYAIDDSVVFTGGSRWFAMMTIESFNGQRLTLQGNFVKWYASNAFGGGDYSNTPVAAVAHLEEPQYWNVNSPEIYFGLWQAGRCFAICAWLSRNTPYFQAVGDPFVAK
jgi:hypothetical protein